MTSEQSQIKFILMDVEGTTTSISFVHDELFPYSRQKMRDFLQQNQLDPEIQQICHSIISEFQNQEGFKKSISDVPEILESWIDQDRKHPALKFIQGKIWKQGYEAGEIKGHVYPDVPEAFSRWKNKDYALGIYSSGSAEAQKLLFRYSIHGDLTPYLSRHFDLSVGGKRDSASYLTIAKNLNLETPQILFLSDIKEELEAAKLAGMSVVQLLRIHSTQIGAYKSCDSFREIFP
jgi:enolase-phosphatase E1